MAKAIKEKTTKTAKANKSGKIPELLAFERKLEPSDGLLFAGNWKEDTWRPIIPHEMRGRGTKSQFGVAEKEMADANPVCIDVASLPLDCDTLKLVFSLRILPLDGIPSGCNQAKAQQLIKEYVEKISSMEEGPFVLLAHRYAWNIASGRFFWRNRRGAMIEDLKIKVFQIESGKKTEIGTFSGAHYSLRMFDGDIKEPKAFDKLKNVIGNALKAKTPSALLEIEAFRLLGAGQAVYPSQEFIDKKGSKEGGNSRIFYKLPFDGKEGGISGIHSQKIGNALRTIDTWYPDAMKVNGAVPIAVEPYGAVPTQGESFRAGKDNSFYAYLERILKTEDEEISILKEEEAAFFLAVLVRGGVFGG